MLTCLLWWFIFQPEREQFTGSLNKLLHCFTGCGKSAVIFEYLEYFPLRFINDLDSGQCFPLQQRKVHTFLPLCFQFHLLLPFMKLFLCWPSVQPEWVLWTNLESWSYKNREQWVRSREIGEARQDRPEASATFPVLEMILKSYSI